MPSIKETPSILSTCESPGSSSLSSVSQKAPISILYEIPYYAVSGLSVKYLKIIENSGYQALPWVRYLTRNGSKIFLFNCAYFRCTFQNAACY